jgi:hypothetical protein
MDYLKDLQVVANTQIKLSDWDPDFTGSISKNYAEDLLNKELGNQMPPLQYKLFADKSEALLIILQGMDLENQMKKKSLTIIFGVFINICLQREKL